LVTGLKNSHKSSTVLRAKNAKKRAKKTYLGIYTLGGDTLKWCVSTPGNARPTEFATKGSQFMLVLKRQKD
jgi:uncharacterized protein (TIGR03067 family)